MIINITSLLFHVRWHVIRYLYTDDIKLTQSNIVQIRNLAKKYILEDLYGRCIAHWKRTTDARNVCDLLNYGVKFGEESVIQLCLNVCASQTTAVLKLDQFKHLSHAALLTLLGHDYLPIDEEEAIIRACLDWAKTQNKIGNTNSVRVTLGACIYKMRFFQLSAEVFANIFDTSPVFTDTEMNLFLCSMLTKTPKHAQRLQDLGFNIYSRCFICNRPGYFLQQHSSYTGEETIDISVSDTCVMTGVSVYVGNQQHDAHIKMSNRESRSALSIIKSTLIPSKNELVTLFFPQKVKLVSGQQYVLKAKLSSCSSCFSLERNDFAYRARNQPEIVTITYHAMITCTEPVERIGYIKSFHFLKAFI